MFNPPLNNIIFGNNFLRLCHLDTEAQIGKVFYILVFIFIFFWGLLKAGKECFAHTYT